MGDVEITVEEDVTKDWTKRTEAINNGTVRKDETAKQKLTFLALLTAKKEKVILTIKVGVFLAYMAYVGYAFSISFGDEGSIRLLVCTLCGLIILCWRQLKMEKRRKLPWKLLVSFYERKKLRRAIKLLLNIVVGGVAVTYTVLYSLKNNPENMVSLSGIAVFFILLFATSTNRSAINWHTIYWGFLLQILVGIFIVRSEIGVSIMIYIRDRFSEFLSYSDAGAAFVFSEKYTEFNFIFRSLPHVLFYVTMINVLTYLGVISFVVRTLGNFLAFCLGTGAVESVVAASNIIMGSNEVFMTVRPYLYHVSLEELFCMLVCGLSSVGGAAFIIFHSYGASIEHLLSASLMSAPAALVCAKLNMPNIQIPVDDKIENNRKSAEARENSPRNVLEAITKGAQIGTLIVTTIAVNNLIYLSLTDFLNATLSWFGDRVNIPDVTFEKVSSYLLWPFAFLMGVPVQDCPEIGRFLGIRALTNAGLAFIQMGKYLDNKNQLTIYESSFNDSVVMENGDVFLPSWNTTLQNGVLMERTEVIGTFALCGFSSIPSIGLALGVFGSIFPHRLQDVSKIIFRAFLVSTLASYITACIAGLLYVEDTT